MTNVQNLNNLDWWRDKSLNDLYFFCRVVLSTLENPKPGFKDLYKPTHGRIAEFVSTYAQPGHKLLILCPRGWIKSYIITLGWLLQKILKNAVNGKRDAVLLSNATLGNAQMFLKRLKDNLAHNSLLRTLFSDIIPANPETGFPRWTMDEVEIIGNRIEVGSVEGNLVSRHYTIHIEDDLVNLENSRTPEQIAKVIEWWKLAQALLESNGIEIIIGTRWAVDDLYGYLLKTFFNIDASQQDKDKEKSAVEYHNGRYHYLRFSCWDNPIKRAGSTFPTLFPEEKLKQLQIELGEHFSGQYENDPFLSSERGFASHWFKTYSVDLLPTAKITYMLIDPMGKESKQSDYMGLVVVDAGHDKNLYVRFAERAKLTDAKAGERIIEVALVYEPDFICIEEFRFSAFRDLITFIIPQWIRQGRIPKTKQRYAALIPYRLVELKHKNRPKKLRIINLSGWIEGGRVLFAPSGMNQLYEELTQFGKTERDDILDAFAYILDIVQFPDYESPVKDDEVIKSPEEIMLERDWEEACQANQPQIGVFDDAY